MLKLLLVAALFALLTYAVVRAIQRRGVARSPKRKPTPRPQPKRYLAPDDDPDFLRDLDRERKRKQPEDPEAN